MEKRSKLVGLGIVFTCVFVLTAAAWAAFPQPQGFVNDFANVLDRHNQSELQILAEQLRKDQGVELAVVTVPTTEPLDPKEYTTGLFNEWGLGGPEDSGLLILLAVAERAIEVEPGYGLEGVLPDGLIGAVIDQEGLPHFREGDYGAGLTAMAKAYAAILAGEKFEIAEEKKPDLGWLYSFLIFLLIVLLLRRQRKHPPRTGGGSGGSSRRTILIPGPTIGGPRLPRGGFGGPRPSGGFGGFGGGRSGGGGAGRRF
ncbi:MAG TPA: TPM domain-containing protein [Limnochordia bacterium]|nr:TPM domain-containing protein [Limnochordia bacterium]